MENILNTNEEQNLVKLFKLKNIAYHETLKEYIFILYRVKNVKFDKKIEYKDIDLTTVLIDKNIVEISKRNEASVSSNCFTLSPKIL